MADKVIDDSFDKRVEHAPDFKNTGSLHFDGASLDALPILASTDSIVKSVANYGHTVATSESIEPDEAFTWNIFVEHTELLIVANSSDDKSMASCRENIARSLDSIARLGSRSHVNLSLSIEVPEGYGSVDDFVSSDVLNNFAGLRSYFQKSKNVVSG